MSFSPRSVVLASREGRVVQAPGHPYTLKPMADRQSAINQAVLSSSAPGL
jgi:hypothetical protein